MISCPQPTVDSEPEYCGTSLVDVAVSIAADGWSRMDGDPTDLCVAAARAGLDRRVNGRCEVSVVLTDDATVQDLNTRYRQQDRPTDVLSFPINAAASPAAKRLLGDVVLAYETVAADAEQGSKSLDAHVCHLVVHGCLHLLGHDHLDEADAALMRRLEVEALAELGLGDPYCAVSPAGSVDEAR